MLETPEACARLRRKLEQWPKDRRSPITINQGLELLDMVERLEKEADWLVEKLKFFCHFTDCVKCGYAACPVRGRTSYWREAAREGVKEQCKSN